jgi:hypothetical protein
MHIMATHGHMHACIPLAERQSLAPGAFFSATFAPVISAKGVGAWLPRPMKAGEPSASSAPSSSGPSLSTPQTGILEANRVGKKRQRVREASQVTAETSTLRLFSLKVCQVVENMCTTTYSEVADRLVDEILGDRLRGESRDCEERNVRR